MQEFKAFQMPTEPRLILPAELVGVTIKALTVHQPWATLLGLGIKTIETRGWGTEYRGPLLIQAGKKWGTEEQAAARIAIQYLSREAVQAAVPKDFLRLLATPPGDLLGKAVAIVNVTGCRQMPTAPDRVEELFGFFGPGRYGWQCSMACPLAEPIEVRGMQGLFQHTFPGSE